MGIWSRLKGTFVKSNDPVGSEIAGDLADWGASAAGIAVNAITSLSHVTVMACVSIISEDMAKLPVFLYRRMDNGGKIKIANHPLAKLLKQPNQWQTRFEFMEMMQAALTLRSNAFAVKITNDAGVVEQLVPVHPDRVTLYEAPSGDWFYMVTRQGLHEMAVLQEVPILVHSEDMFHLRWMPTWNSLLGTSRISLMRDAVGLGMSLEQQAARFSGNGARPAGVLETDKALSKEVIERLKSDWNAKYGGWRQAGKMAVLEDGLKWKALTMSNVDAEFMESRKFQLADIARGFRIPLHKLGVIGEGPGSSFIQQEQAYLNDVLSSWCERWIAKLEMEFDIEDDMFVEFDYDHFLKADIQTRLTAKRTGVIGMIYTPNEARRSEGLPDVKGGDTLYQPTNVAPIGFVPSGNGGAGPGSDVTGEPALGGDGDGSRPLDDDSAPSD